MQICCNDKTCETSLKNSFSFHFASVQSRSEFPNEGLFAFLFLTLTLPIVFLFVCFRWWRPRNCYTSFPSTLQTVIYSVSILASIIQRWLVFRRTVSGSSEIYFRFMYNWLPVQPLMSNWLPVYVDETSGFVEFCG